MCQPTLGRGGPYKPTAKGERAGREAKERRWIIDGAVCPKSNLEVLPLQAITLDFYHFSERGGAAGVATLGTDTPESKAFLEKTLHTARHEGYAPALVVAPYVR
jgi:hypothetical protein